MFNVFLLTPFNPGACSSGQLLILLFPLFLPATDSALGPFASARIGLGILSSDGKTAPVAYAPVTAQIHQPLDVHADLAPQVPFNLIVFLDDIPEFGYLFLG
jgi:hypothetical protein